MKLRNILFPASPGGGMPLPPEERATTAPEAPAPPLRDASHVDYDLHPLRVASLEHYVEQPVGNERFRIS
jgi:hypothetical protein